NWLHWPIRDLGAPSDSSESAAAFASWAEALTSGKRLLFHCAAGLGRTGTLAARLLIATGVSPQSAIEAVRSARPGTVESPEQERFLREPS
ncbi:MAG: protein-tyrosine phosphatase family protein, partial [Arenicellales bacterium]